MRLHALDSEACLPACFNVLTTSPARLCPQLVMEVMKKLEGAYALLIKSRHYPGEMVAAKRGSPMIVGIKEGQAKKSGGGLTHRCACMHMRLPCVTRSGSHMHHTCVVGASTGHCSACQCDMTVANACMTGPTRHANVT
jgi:hypothetical protein